MTKRIKSRIQAAEMGFLRRVAGVSLKDKVKQVQSSMTNSRVELLLLCVKRS